MDTWSGTSWCVSQVCEQRSVAEVAALLDTYSTTGARVTVAGGALELVGDRMSRNGVTPMAPQRAHRARLRYARWLPKARVTVEVEPWSADTCVLLIRPARRLPPAPDTYLRTAVAIVQAIAADVDRTGDLGTGAVMPADAPLRRAS